MRERNFAIYEMQSSLECIGCTGKYNMWQNMLFDKSTATVDHIDSWYLDTDLPGHLVGHGLPLRILMGVEDHFMFILNHIFIIHLRMKFFKSHDEMLESVKNASINFAEKPLL